MLESILLVAVALGGKSTTLYSALKRIFGIVRQMGTKAEADGRESERDILTHMMYNTLAQILRAPGTLLGLLPSAALLLSAQSPSNRVAHVTVTDPLGRFVTGLGTQDFWVVENGTTRPVAAVSQSDCSAAIAIVSDSPLAEKVAFCSGADELIQTQSVSSTLRYLAASTNACSALVAVTGHKSSELISRGNSGN